LRRVTRVTFQKLGGGLAVGPPVNPAVRPAQHAPPRSSSLSAAQPGYKGKRGVLASLHKRLSSEGGSTHASPRSPLHTSNLAKLKEDDGNGGVAGNASCYASLCVMEGWVNKRSESSSQWRRRFLVLLEHTGMYFHSVPQSRYEVPRGRACFPLFRQTQLVAPVAADERTFGLRFSRELEPDYVFQADSHELCDSWTRAFGEVLARIPPSLLYQTNLRHTPPEVRSSPTPHASRYCQTRTKRGALAREARIMCDCRSKTRCGRRSAHWSCSTRAGATRATGWSSRCTARCRPAPCTRCMWAAARPAAARNGSFFWLGSPSLTWRSA
jgi:hypothetical protein